MKVSIHRTHVEVGREPRRCVDHGEYLATKWDLKPKPVDYPRLPGNHKQAVATYLNPFWGNCPKCDAEMQLEADQRDQVIKGGMTERQRLAGARMEAAKIPERYKEASVWKWQHQMDQQRHVWNWARDYCSQFDIALQTGRCGVFTGAPGTGKTLLACGILSHLLEKGSTGLYTTAADLLSRIRATFSRDSDESEPEAYEAFRLPDMLVIDEVGRQADTQHENTALFRVLDSRYANLKPVLLVSNLNKQKLQDFLGAAIWDRVREAGGAILNFDWPSQRSTKRPEES